MEWYRKSDNWSILEVLVIVFGHHDVSGQSQFRGPAISEVVVDAGPNLIMVQYHSFQTLKSLRLDVYS